MWLLPDPQFTPVPIPHHVDLDIFDDVEEEEEEEQEQDDE